MNSLDVYTLAFGLYCGSYPLPEQLNENFIANTLKFKSVSNENE